MTSKSHHDSGEQGRVKDPQHDGRLKENREAGHTKGTTPGSESRQRQHEGGRSGGQSMGSPEQHSGGSQRHDSSGGSGSDDLKSREYRDAQGNIHHHTRTSQDMKK